MSARAAAIVLDRASLLRMTAAGGVGGGLNATLCVLGWPVPVPSASFRWHLIPAGIAHGGLLALAAIVGVAASSRTRHSLWRWFAAPIVGWLGGYASWIPLEMSVFGRSLSHAIVWPAGSDPFSLAFIWNPLIYFGGVSALLDLWLASATARHSPKMAVVGAALAASLGSLCWWIEWGPWYFSLLHGGVWGTLVGFAALRRGRAATTQPSPLFPGNLPPIPDSRPV
jgi:hypothetical protein